jgi:hypothetical protein
MPGEPFEPAELCRRCGTVLPAGHRIVGVCVDCVAQAVHAPPAVIPRATYGWQKRARG